MAAYEPQLEDEVGFEMGKIVKVIQKNLDGWWFIMFEEEEGWIPSMFLREVASSQHNARQKGKHAAVRAMLRDTRLNSISAIAGRRQTWDPLQGKRVWQKRKIPPRANQAESSSTAREDSFTTKPARSYVNLEFHDVTKRPAGRRNPRQKMTPNEVRAGCRFGKELNSEVKDNAENTDNGLLSDALLKPRPLSFVEEESHETVSRGTSPIPSPLLRRDSNNSGSESSSSGKSPDEGANVNEYVNVELLVQDTESEHTPVPEDGAKDGIEHGAEDRAEDRAEDGAEYEAKVEAKDKTEDGAEDGTEAGAENGAKNGAEDEAEDGADDEVDDGAKDGAKDGAEDGGKDGAEDEDEDGAEDEVEEKAEDGLLHDVDDGAKDGAEDGGKDGAEDEDEGEEYTENMPELVNNNMFYAMGPYDKEDDEEVNLRENAEVEVLEESEGAGGWCEPLVTL
ncbi:SH3 and PX domain-containing protein 2B [Desmophyllum pertusum]|uniref:SH3 and PX domain-containing protein 2B n=1 Tax=Desmophyllum pertusum TaxID=174260 RepID=A0A9X0CF92_9CNID|nr:SH3 and PX domain-containing protein 2B [Desmophyllum pertusum]